MSHGFSSVDEVLILLTYANLSSKEVDIVKKGLLENFRWDEFVRKIKHNDIGPLIHHTLMKNELLDLLPPEIQHYLSEQREKILEINSGRLKVAIDIFSKFELSEVKVIVLKGVLFGETIYKDPGYKKMNDLDILVRSKDIEKVRKIYGEVGLVPLALLEGDDQDFDEKKSYHLPAFISRDLKFVVGTHWGLTSPKLGFNFDYEEIWKRAVSITISGQRALALSPEDNLHHLCVHFHYYKTGLKEFADLANLLRETSKFSWQTFGDQIEKAQSYSAVFRPLSILESIYNIGIPKDLLRICRDKTDSFTIRDTERLGSRKDLILLSRSTYSSQIEKAYLAFSFESTFRKKLPWFFLFWKRLLMPPRQVLYSTNACNPKEKSLFLLYLINLWRTAREVGKGYGIIVFGFLMLKSAWELISSLKSIFSNESGGKMGELRNALGQDEEKILKLMNSFE
ncbi:nucleotidyltransferase family protein [bacterium]|nr:nucleotidyltransferase family protein [bacterium]